MFARLLRRWCRQSRQRVAQRVAAVRDLADHALDDRHHPARAAGEVDVVRARRRGRARPSPAPRAPSGRARCARGSRSRRSDDSGTRPPSGSTSVTGRLRPPYRFAMIFCSGSAIVALRPRGRCGRGIDRARRRSGRRPPGAAAAAAGQFSKDRAGRWQSCRGSRAATAAFCRTAPALLPSGLRPTPHAVGTP